MRGIKESYGFKMPALECLSIGDSTRYQLEVNGFKA